jgi:predicted Fe-S protein YdhL (DUF1289 family)
MVPRDFGPRQIMSIIETTIESPCNRVCVVHPTAGFCIGCGRSLDEIGRWIGLNNAERSRITAQLPARLAALDGANATVIQA